MIYVETSNYVVALSAGVSEPGTEGEKQTRTPHHIPASMEIPEALSAFLHIRALDGLLRPWEAERSINNKNSERYYVLALLHACIDSSQSLLSPHLRHGFPTLDEIPKKGEVERFIFAVF